MMSCCGGTTGMGAYGAPPSDLEVSRAWNTAHCGSLGWKNNVIQSGTAPYLYWAPGHPNGIKDCNSSAFATRVVGYQAAKGLPQDGKLGPTTLASLQGRALPGATGPPEPPSPPPPAHAIVVDDSTKPWYMRQGTLMVGGVVLVAGGLYFAFGNRS